MKKIINDLYKAAFSLFDTQEMKENQYLSAILLSQMKRSVEAFEHSIFRDAYTLNKDLVIANTKIPNEEYIFDLPEGFGAGNRNVCV